MTIIYCNIDNKMKFITTPREGRRAMKMIKKAPEGSLVIRRDGIYRKQNNEVVKIKEYPGNDK